MSQFQGFGSLVHDTVRNRDATLCLASLCANKLSSMLMLSKCIEAQARRRGGQEGAGAPPAFQLGEQGEQKCPF